MLVVIEGSGEQSIAYSNPEAGALLYEQVVASARFKCKSMTWTRGGELAFSYGPRVNHGAFVAEPTSNNKCLCTDENILYIHAGEEMLLVSEQAVAIQVSFNFIERRSGKRAGDEYSHNQRC